MNKKNLTSILRFVSLMSIFISGVFLFKLEIIPNVPADNIIVGTMHVRDFILENVNSEEIIPRFLPSLQSLFSKQAPPSQEKKKLPENKTEPLEIPHLTFIGMVDTGKKVLYSFKNINTKKLLFLEKGISINGLTLLECQNTVCTLKTGNKIFQVVKE